MIHCILLKDNTSKILMYTNHHRIQAIPKVKKLRQSSMLLRLQTHQLQQPTTKHSEMCQECKDFEYVISYKLNSFYEYFVFNFKIN